MLEIIIYGIYFIKHDFFRFIHVNNFILSQLRPIPTTYAIPLRRLANNMIYCATKIQAKTKI